YSLIKIKEWPPHIYNEYNGVEDKGAKQENPGVVKLLKNAPSTFWTVGLVQFFCWFAFLFLWTYATNTVAFKAFDTPTTQSVVGIRDGKNLYEAKNLLIQDSILIVSHGQALAEGVTAGGVFYPASQIVVNGNDTIVSDHYILNTEDGLAKATFGKTLSDVRSLSVDGKNIEDCRNVVISDYLSRLQGPVQLTEAAIVAKSANGKLSVEDASTVNIANAADCSYETKTVLNSATPQYNNAGNWVGLLYAIQAIGSVIWAVVLPKFRSRKFSYSLSLLLAGIGFILMSFMTNQWILFIAFLLIGCGWAAMLAWPFTILTNSLKSGNIGAYLGLFNCTICVPQIIAALAGGWILSLMSTPGELAPEYMMMMIAGIAIIIGSVCVFFIKENIPADEKVQETPAISENI
ncbi:MAG: MFS transporter, partial [Muribaculaceae bacterium]|nr:MFS transporter [Muribaculaceae bacterium]